MFEKIVQSLYNMGLREHLPQKIGSFNGVALRHPRLFDRTDVRPDWKNGTVSAVRDGIQRGDTVIEVGTGLGICTVWAAQQVGVSGHVYTYEARRDRHNQLRETLRLNGVSDRVTAEHGAIGPPKDVSDDAAQIVQSVSYADLPQPHVLVMDCEGCEKAILEHLDEIKPRTVIVEVHTFAGVDPDWVTDILDEHGYVEQTTQQARPYETDRQLPVITAHLRGYGR